MKLTFRLVASVLLMGVLAVSALAQSGAYSFKAKRFDPVVSADVYKLKATPLGDLDGLMFAGYRKDGDAGNDTMPVGLGVAKRFPFGENLSFQAGLHVITAKGAPIDGGLLIGFAYHPTPRSSLAMGPNMRGGLGFTYHTRF